MDVLQRASASGKNTIVAHRHPRLFIFPETTLARFTADTRDRLKIRTLCVAGDPQMKFTKVSSIPGAAGATPKFNPWKRPEVEVLAAGGKNCFFPNHVHPPDALNRSPGTPFDRPVTRLHDVVKVARRRAASPALQHFRLQ
ncbi:MAG: hypothetical protein M3Z85_08570 [Acidobacteriota bacterium]|nr:hypothetical protein [Acidobacteriota bacterium]